MRQTLLRIRLDDIWSMAPIDDITGVGLGYVEQSETNKSEGWLDGKFEIEVAGIKYDARASLAPLFDPENRRIRC